MIMKLSLLKSCALLSLLSVMVSCGPSKYTMHLEMRQPSKAGMNMDGKILSVVYLESGQPLQDGFTSYLAGGFAESLQKNYGTGDESVGVFKMQRSAGGDYSVKDSLVNILMDTGSDVVFLIDDVKLGEISLGGKSKVSYAAVPDSSYITTCSVPYTLRMYGFDAMNKSEQVKTFGGTSVAQVSVYSDGSLSQDALKVKAYEDLPEAGWDVGEFVGLSFEPQWKVEGFSMIYFDSEKWMQALEKADQFDWKGAMDIWFELADSNDVLKRASAAYNISLACFIMGDYKLAKEWLDLSDNENKLPVSDALRKRIDSRIQ